MPTSQQSPKERTAFGLWVQEQNANRSNNGAISDVREKTRLAYTTVFNAQFRRVTRKVARAISRATGGAVDIADIAKPATKGRKRAVRS